MKVKKLLSVLLTLAVILTVCSVTAFAAGGEFASADFATNGINKTLNVADGINIDDVDEFTFRFTPQASDTVAVADVPAIADKTVTVGAQSGGVATGMTSFADIINGITFPHAGEYIYQVVETTEAFETTANGVTKKLTVDPAVYTVHVFVTNGDNDALAVSNIIVKDADGDKSDLDFENTYTEVITNPLAIEKEITGAYGDKSKTFPVTVTLTLPATANYPADFAVEGQTTSGGTAPEVTVTGTAPTIVVTANLADGDKIVFTKLPAGTTFVVEEDQDSVYRAKVTGFVNPEDTEYSAYGTDVNKNGNGPVVAAGNNVHIENNREYVVPTGVVIDNLPYVLLFVIAVAGVVYLHLKKKARA